MLKDIRLHLEQDEEKQTIIEQALAADIVKTHAKNIQAFHYHIPSVIEYVQNIRSSHISLFCNKNHQKNIVDYGNGRTFYGLDPESEIAQQFELFCQYPQYTAFNQVQQPATEAQTPEAQTLESQVNYQAYLARPPLPENCELVVVLGIGLALHIQALIEHKTIKHIVIYEPEIQYFQCSVMATNWEKILDKAKEKGTCIYLQLGKDGRDIISDLTEFLGTYPAEGFYLYPHYHHPIFDNINKSLNSGWQFCLDNGIRSEVADKDAYLPIWTQAINLKNLQTPNQSNHILFENNLDAFKKYVPSIVKEFEAYEPKNWFAVENEINQINLVERQNLACFHGDNPRQECEQNFENFSQYPNKDGLVLGYTGTKLKHYLHYQFVAKTEKLLNTLEEEQGALPETLKSLILFGIGTGYQLETLFEKHQVEKLFICEPNRDYFYASLFAIDWATILTHIDKSGGRIYLNIGDDGTHLFRDLLNQFYAIGPYILANTYFYQSYYNSTLVQTVAQLREQLQVVISMGEYYDHARYGIAHTTETITRGYPFLTKNPAQKLTKQNKEVPVFLVGNGPSLDQSIKVIKEWQGQAIIVSCGTALMPLYKNGIVPDFHAEIEQNRSTFDWICRVGDFEYLKNISLISCNGIHPDTCDLFKDIYIAFKEGESSTVSALNLLNRKDYEELQFAFPTVSNFALNIFTKMGFNQLYLMGIDLGFVDSKKHHSTQSGYYHENGTEAYNYREKNNTALVVPGNFRPTVFTKHEFKVSKAILEQTLASHKIDCFNCSDGALVFGSTPLCLDNILLVTTSHNKTDTLSQIKQVAFKAIPEFIQYADKFNLKYKQKNLEFELNGMIELVKQPINSVDDVENVMTKQKEMLFASYQNGQSLLFFLLYGTVNYVNALISRCLSIKEDISFYSSILEKWLGILNTIIGEQLNPYINFDHCASFIPAREKIYLLKLKKIYQFSPVLKNSDQQDVFFEFIKDYYCPNNIINKKKFTKELVFKYKGKGFSSLCQFENVTSNPTLFGTLDDIPAKWLKSFLNNNHCNSVFWWLGPAVIEGDIESVYSGNTPIVHPRRCHFVAKFLYDMDKIALFLPKYIFCHSETENIKRYLSPIVNSLSFVNEFIEFPDYIAVPRVSIDIYDCILDSVGSRGVIAQGKITAEALMGRKLSRKQAKQIIDTLDLGQ